MGRLETSRKIALNGKKFAERPQRLRLYTASSLLPRSSASSHPIPFASLSLSLSLFLFFSCSLQRRGECQLVSVGNFSALSLTRRNPSTANLPFKHHFVTLDDVILGDRLSRDVVISSTRAYASGRDYR